MTLTHILPLKPLTEGCLDPYYSPTSHQAQDSTSSSVYSSNQSSRSSSKSAKKPVAKPVVIHHNEDAPKDRDPSDKTTDPRYYKNSYLDSGEPENKDSMKKAFDARYYQNSSYYKD